MSDRPTETPRLPFEAAADLLSADRAPIGLAEAHGLLSGLLTVRPDTELALWSAAIFDDRRPQSSAPLLEALHELTAQQLAGDDLAFRPFLPDDSAPLPIRAEAYADWCQGFLSGLGLGGLDADRVEGDADEFLRDLDQIARIDFDGIEEGEESERDLMELGEYLRVGVYLIRDAAQAAGPREDEA